MNYPLVYVTVAFALGIVLQSFISLPLLISFLTIVIFLVFSVCALLKRKSFFWLCLVLAFLAGVISYQIKTLSASAPPDFAGKGHLVSEPKAGVKFAVEVRGKFNDTLLKILPADKANLLGSILLGTVASPLPHETKEEFRNAGLIHLLVVSGTQVSILIGICLGFARMLGLPLWLAVLATSLFNLMLVLVTGGGPSILRAAVMGEITLLGLLFERDNDAYNSLALSALILLIINPYNLFDIGFQLSFAATWSLFYLAPILKDNLSLSSLLSMSIAPLLATAPIIAYNFSQVSLGAILANLIVLPWIEVLVIFGFMNTLLGFLVLPLAQFFGYTLWVMLFALEGVAKFISSLPFALFYIKSPTLPLVFGYYAGLILAAEMVRREKRFYFSPKRLVAALLVVLSIFIWHTAVAADLPWEKKLIVSFIDVGQGDSILIETPAGKKILIDGGGAKWEKSVRFLHRKGINHLDLIILTHPHEDHLGGLNPVLEQMKADQVMEPGQVYDSNAYRRFRSLIQANQIKYALGRAGQVINFEENLKGYILNPPETLYQDPNNNSMVMKLVYGDISFLLAGDLEQEGEGKVLSFAPADLNSTVLKVGHHGSKTSTSDEFLAAVNPQIAVISVGRWNRYHHPHSVTLQKLEAGGINTYRTDERGTVTMKTDGKQLEVVTER